MSNRRRRVYKRAECGGTIAPGAWKICEVCDEPGKIAMCWRCLAIKCLRCFDKEDGCCKETYEETDDPVQP